MAGTDVPGRGRVTHQGEDHPEVPRPGLRGEGLARAPEGPAEEQARHRRQEGLHAAVRARSGPRPRRSRSSRRRARRPKAPLRRHRPRPGRRGDRLAHRRRSSRCPGRRVFRVLFNEITEKAVKAAFKPPRARSTRSGSTPSRPAASSTAWWATRSAPSSGSKVRRGLSAGRVQSVAAAARSSSASGRSGPSSPRSTGASTPTWPPALPPEFVAALREKDGEKLVPSTEAETQADRRRGRAGAVRGQGRSTGASAARTRRRPSSPRPSSRTRPGSSASRRPRR